MIKNKQTLDPALLQKKFFDTAYSSSESAVNHDKMWLPNFLQ